MVDKELQQNNSSIQAILFDWSGTISDDRRPVYEANKKMCDYWGVPNESFEEWTRGASMTPIEGFREKGVTASGDEIYAVYQKYFHESLEAGIRPSVYDDALSTLQKLNVLGLPLGIVSAHPQVYLVEEARDYQIQPLVQVLHGDARNKVKSLTSVCQMLDLEPETTMYVGDTIFDIRSAREAGLIQAGITTGYHSREALTMENPTFLLNTLSEIVTILTI